MWSDIYFIHLFMSRHEDVWFRFNKC